VNSEARIVANALLSYLAQAVRALVALLLVPFLLTNLGQGGYGVIGIIQSILGFVVLMEFGIRPAATREFARLLYGAQSRRSNELAATAMAAYLALAVAIVAVVASTGEGLLRLFRAPEDLVGDGFLALVFASSALGSALVTTPYTAALASQLRHDIQHYGDIFDSLFRLGFIVAAFSLWRPSIQLWAIASLIPAAIVLLFMRWQAHLRCPSLELGWKLVSLRGARDLAGPGLYTSVAQLAEWLNRQSGPLIIGYFLGAALVAHYTPAMLLATTLQALSASFLLQLQPFVTKAAVEAQIQRIGRVLVRSTRYSILSSGAAAAWFGSLSPAVVACWLGEGFGDTVVVLRLWCATIFLHACVGASFAVFLGMGRFRFVAAVNGSLGLIAMGGALLLVGILDFGAAGAAIAVLGAQAIRTIVWIRGAARIAGVGAREYLRESIAGPLACVASVVGTSLAVQSLIEARPWAELAVAGLPSLAAYAALAWRIGLNAQDRDKAIDYARSGLRQTFAILGRR
jgi:O-antigen/teichoic acid export membrane protein